MLGKLIVGKKGEDVASEFLIKQDFIIVERNYHTRYGEIDLIAEKNNNLYFFEVKYRKNNKFGLGELAITDSKIRKIKKSILIWLRNRKSTQHSQIFLNAIVIDPDLSLHLYEIN